MPYRLFIFLPQNWKTAPLPILRKKKWTHRQRLERKRRVDRTRRRYLESDRGRVSERGGGGKCYAWLRKQKPIPTCKIGAACIFAASVPDSVYISTNNVNGSCSLLHGILQNKDLSELLTIFRVLRRCLGPFALSVAMATKRARQARAAEHGGAVNTFPALALCSCMRWQWLA